MTASVIALASWNDSQGDRSNRNAGILFAIVSPQPQFRRGVASLSSRVNAIPSWDRVRPTDEAFDPEPANR
jgi:hypothetical protein